MAVEQPRQNVPHIFKLTCVVSAYSISWFNGKTQSSPNKCNWLAGSDEVAVASECTISTNNFERALHTKKLQSNSFKGIKCYC